MGCLIILAIAISFCLMIVFINEAPIHAVFALSFLGLLVYVGNQLFQYRMKSKMQELDEEGRAQEKKKLLIISSACVACLIGAIVTNPSPPTPEQLAQTRQKMDEDIKNNKERNERMAADREAKRKEEEELKKKAEEEAALQKKYDDQKKYEEWLAWKKEEAKRQAQKAEDDRKAEAEKRRKEQERRRQEENKYQAINISALLNEIRSNAARAKYNFNGKYLKMEGIVLTIESDGDNIVISDGEYNLIPAVHCMPSRNNKTVREKIFHLNKGQYVTVYGKVTNIGETIGCYFELEKIQ